MTQNSTKNNQSPPEKKNLWAELWELVRSLGGIVLLALLIRTFGIAHFHIPSGSMIPTHLVGDHLFVSKFAYGFSKYSFSPFDFDLFKGRVFFREPKRGDIVVFRPPQEKVDYIKRLVGLPGDKIQMLGGVLHINGQAVKMEAMEDFEYYNEVTKKAKKVSQYLETLPNGVRHRIIKEKPLGLGTMDNTPEYTVPAGHYFMMGDNRDNSTDSRYLTRVGYIPAENLIGRADLHFFSINKAIAVHWWEFWKWPVALRYDRILRFIE